MRSWYQWSRPSACRSGCRRAHDDHAARWTVASPERHVGLGLEREHLAPAVAAVRRHQHLGLGVVDAVGQRRGREAAEHHAVRGADAGAGQHGHGRLGDHRQVDVDPVAPLHAEALQHVGEALHLGQQLGVRDDTAVAGLALPVVGHPVAPARSTWRSRQLAATLSLPPMNHWAKGGSHWQMVCHSSSQSSSAAAWLGPEALVVDGRLVVQERAGDEGGFLEALRRRERAVLEQQVVDRLRDLVGHGCNPPGSFGTDLRESSRGPSPASPDVSHPTRGRPMRVPHL